MTYLVCVHCWCQLTPDGDGRYVNVRDEYECGGADGLGPHVPGLPVITIERLEICRDAVDDMDETLDKYVRAQAYLQWKGQ